MKKKLCISLILVTALMLGCALAAEQTTTLLVYMCGTDLQSDACIDLVEMAEVEAGDAINVVVLAGGAKEWDLEDLKAGSRTLAVIRDGYFEELDDWGYASMGSPDSLAEFLEYGMSEYPADRMMVVLWDHGAGSEAGVCFDETTADDDGLTVAEINGVLENLKQSVPDYHIDIFGCDACMMATYEMAAMLSHHPIDYYIASEELEPGTGWYYTGWLEALKNNPSLSNGDLCGLVVDTYMEEGLEQQPDDYLTLSAVDLSVMPDLEKSMEQFASVMSGQVEGGNLSAVRRGRSRMYTFGSFADGSWDMVDLGAVLNAYAQFDADTAAEARRCLNKAVIANRQTDNLDACCGLSVLIPQDTADTFDTYREGFDLSSVIPNWIGFVNTYVSELTGGSYHISASSTSQISAGSDYSGSFFSSLGSCPGACMTWDEETESYSEDTSGEEIGISDTDAGFTAQLSQEDLANLDYVEGLLMMEVEDGDSTFYVDFGSMQNNLIDWNSGMVCSLYDGSMPFFGDQPVPMYDQTKNENSRRSLIPVKLNGEYTYLVVVFAAGSDEGRIIGANAGYDDNGLPIRNTTKLDDGDVIVPVYTMYYEEDGQEDLAESEFLGDEIVWHEGMTVTYMDPADEDEPIQMMFCFVFNDIFGGDTMSEIVSFEL